MLEAHSLGKKFGAVSAVADLSLCAVAGAPMALLGPNGAGKTTTLRMMSGFLHPSAGRACVDGFDVVQSPQAARAHLGYLPEGAPLYGEMTPLHLLHFVAQVRGFSRPEARRRVGAVIERLALHAVVDQKIDTLSKGYRRRVGLAQAVLHSPPALILDEPTDGLDPLQKQSVRALIAELAPTTAILISTHILEEVEAMCAVVAVLVAGRLVALDTPSGLRSRSRYAQAVGFTLAAEAALPDFGTLPCEQARLPDGRWRLTVLSPRHVPILEPVQAVLRATNTHAQDMTVEAGRLDDVFAMLAATSAGAKSAGEKP